MSRQGAAGTLAGWTCGPPRRRRDASPSWRCRDRSTWRRCRSSPTALYRLVGDHPARRVAVDLDGVDVLDDTGLGVLLGAAGRARQAGGELVVVVSDERLRARFAATGFDRAVDVVDRLAAVTRLTRPTPTPSESAAGATASG